VRGQSLPVHFLMYNADARDGVSRAVLTLANQLSLTHPVEVISLYRRPGGPAYTISERVRVTYLLNQAPVPPGAAPSRTIHRSARQTAKAFLARRRSRLAHGRGFPNLSLLTDRALRRKLHTIRTGVVISTRPSLHAALARLARPGVVTIGQDHLNFLSRSKEPGSMAFIEEACYHGLDAFVTLTAGDADDYRRALGAWRTQVATIPNALPWPVSPPRVHHSRVVVAAGRLVPRKGMARLIRAFAPVAERHPDWELRIYGSGRLEEKLGQQIEQSGLAAQIRLMGHTDDLPAAFDDAAVFASASSAEGFPMVMLEALSKGLPLVGTDCPRGPGDIIRHARNGLLVPNKDVRALQYALETVIGDDDLRRSMGAQALADAEQYVADHIAARWDQLFDHLCGTTSTAAVRPGATAQPHDVDAAHVPGT